MFVHLNATTSGCLPFQRTWTWSAIRRSLNDGDFRTNIGETCKMNSSISTNNFIAQHGEERRRSQWCFTRPKIGCQKRRPTFPKVSKCSSSNKSLILGYFRTNCVIVTTYFSCNCLCLPSAEHIFEYIPSKNKWWKCVQFFSFLLSTAPLSSSV